MKVQKCFSILRASSQFIPSSLNWLLIIEQKMAQPQKRFIVMNSQWTRIPDHTYTKTYISNISIVVYFKHFHFCRCWVYNLLFVWISNVQMPSKIQNILNFLFATISYYVIDAYEILYLFHLKALRFRLWNYLNILLLHFTVRIWFIVN